MLLQLTLHDMVGPRAKRRRCHPAVPTCDVAPLLNSVLQADELCSLIASYLDTNDLVMASCVSHVWLRQFSQPGCWQHKQFHAVTTVSLQQPSAEAFELLDKMPQLYDLYLTEKRYSGLPLTRCYNTRADRAAAAPARPPIDRYTSGLTKLCAGISAEMLQAFPHLQEFTGRVSSDAAIDADAVVFPPGLRKLRLSGELKQEVIDAFVRHPPKQLQSIQISYASVSQLRQFVSACPHLITVYYGETSNAHEHAEAIAALATCQQLTKLTLEYTVCTSAVLNALCALPRLQTLTIRLAEVRIEFWQHLAALGVAMKAHLPNGSDNTKLRIYIHLMNAGYTGNEDPDEWWLSALHAQQYCTELDLAFDDMCERGPSDSVWRRFHSADFDEHTSLLQIISKECFLTNQSPYVLPLIMRHANLTQLDISRQLGCIEEEVHEVLSFLPALRHLGITTLHPRTVQAALQEAGTLHALITLDIRAEYRNNNPNAYLLPKLLRLVRAATGLSSATITASIAEWHHAPLTLIKMCTQHICRLDVGLVDGYICPLQYGEPEQVVSKLLLVPILAGIDCSSDFRPTADDVVKRSRIAKGSNKVWVSVPDDPDCMEWNNYHCVGQEV